MHKKSRTFLCLTSEFGVPPNKSAQVRFTQLWCELRGVYIWVCNFFPISLILYICRIIKVKFLRSGFWGNFLAQFPVKQNIFIW